MNYPLLDTINSPADIKGLSVNQLKQLCAEIRHYIIEVCSTNPGHLGSSLGAVELIVGWHYVFDAPEDKIVFDVGHQAYAHKILTGRREAFRTLRKAGGISGFPRMDESPYDSFGAGHSSTSVSAALGLAEAARIQGRKEKVTALIGDGALTGGLAFEGINNAGAAKADLLVILNDNEISIDHNLGGLHNYLLRVTTSQRYNAFKNKVWNALGERGLRAAIQRWWRSLKSWMVKKTGGDLFEALGFRYFGPIDGNNIEQVINTLIRIKNISGPRVLHCHTVKGKGFPASEADPYTWHAPGRFDPETGKRLNGPYPADRYQDVFGQVLCELAEKDERVVGITPAMASGCGMSKFAAAFPGRFFDVGIEEEHAVTFSAGLAAGGMRPFCNIYSSFAQRAYDQIIHDVALQHLPVVLCFDRAGLVGEDGATHHGCFDIAALRTVPGTIIASPKDETELKQLMYSALNTEHGPYIIRYPRGCGEGVQWKDAPYEILPAGKAVELKAGKKLALVCSGPVTSKAMKIAEKYGEDVGVYNFRFIKPLDTEMLAKIAGQYSHIITLEDGSLKGGLYGAVAEELAGTENAPTVEGIGIPDEFVRHASKDEEWVLCGMDEKSVTKKIENFLENRK
ncbi:MAG: 1-deoxy-D-xylulose-5-phosphate synthase [Bacteroidales bacterium]|nr:1-deoxy-D-xylulose-5-phosphate synthase [Bacteroidales bacterium]